MKRILRILSRDKNSILLPIMVSVMAISLIPFVRGEFSGIDESRESVLLTLVAMGSVMALVMVRFLTGSSSSSANFEINEYEINLLREEFKKQHKKQVSPISEEDENRLADEIHSRINQEANASYIDNLKDEIRASEYRIDISKRGKSTLDRIYREIDALGRRGTVNLVLGVITALSGVTALSFFVLSEEGSHSSMGSFAMEFLPRLSIVLIIEVFSYFFLRLYKSSLAEIKYFQNEATNIEHNFVALEAAMIIDDKALIEKCIYTFLAVERNPILNDGQTTREIIQDSAASKDAQVSPDYLIRVIEAVRSSENNST